MKRFLALAIASVSWLTAADVDQRIQRVVAGLRPVERQVRKLALDERLKFYQVPGVSIAVLDGGKMEWARGFGLTERDGAKPVTPETVFQAASLSKQVAAIVALRLVEQGKLTLDENVNLKLRSWKVPDNGFTVTQKVTLRRLLNHSAGLTVNGFAGYAQGVPVPSLLEVLDGAKPANSAAVRVDILPGTKWRYSGGGYAVMQQLVMDVTGKPFPQLAQETVLGPLDMSHSTFEQPLPPALEGNAATGHRANGAPLPGRWNTYPEMTAAGLWTTPSDLARVILELQRQEGGVLQPATRRQMLTKVLGEYGLGVGLGEKDGQKSFAHSGSNEGFKCTMMGYLQGGSGAVVMTNGDRGAQLATEILRSISAEYAWPDYKP